MGNIHPHDGITKKCTNLKEYDNHNNITSDTFSIGSLRDYCAVKFIIAMNKMRFKQGKGDPSGLKATFATK